MHTYMYVHTHTHTCSHHRNNSSPVDIERSHDLREGEVLSDGPGHAHLVDVQVGVGGDDGTGGEVHPLPHQVAPHSTLLALQTLLDGLQGTAASLDGLGQEVYGNDYMSLLFSLIFLFSQREVLILCSHMSIT